MQVEQLFPHRCWSCAHYDKGKWWRGWKRECGKHTSTVTKNYGKYRSDEIVMYMKTKAGHSCSDWQLRPNIMEDFICRK